MAVHVHLVSEPFDAGTALSGLAGAEAECGAVASFTGQVRGGGGLIALELEHYPGVTEKALTRIARQAAERWSLGQAMIIHRVGRMQVGELIVFVGASAPHRRAALEAVGYMIDVLKTGAPFWKREITAAGASWVEARPEDDIAAATWLDCAAETSA